MVSDIPIQESKQPANTKIILQQRAITQMKKHFRESLLPTNTEHQAWLPLAQFKGPLLKLGHLPAMEEEQFIQEPLTQTQELVRALLSPFRNHKIEIIQRAI
jgi:hypothetical protein